MKAADSSAMEGSNWKKRYEEVRNLSLTLCQPLETEDFVVQPIVEVLGHRRRPGLQGRRGLARAAL